MPPVRSSHQEAKIQEALSFIDENPGAKLRAVAREFGVPRDQLRNRSVGRQSRLGRTPANIKLSKPEEAALCRYIDRLEALNLSVRIEFVRDAANAILYERAPLAQKENPPTVGQHWATRFYRRHGYSKTKQKKLDSDRQAAENIERVKEYFDKLGTVLAEGGFVPEDIWNMDETGFRIGEGKDQMVITRAKRAQYFGIPVNRESATAIEAISASGAHCPAFLIVLGKIHMARWYNLCELPSDAAIGVADTGYTNDELTLRWLKHFDEHTSKQQVGSKRLLILDGHGSHHTRQFIQYCDDHGIVPFGLPPHLTHLLQPLDVVIFQPLKHYHAKALDILVRDGCVNITKLEFLSIIQGVRVQALKESSCKSAFQKCGIWPFNPTPILQQIGERVAAPATPEPQEGPFSSPFHTPLTLRQIHKVSDSLFGNLQDAKDLDPAFRDNVERFVSGAVSLATELVQTKRDLARTKLAEDVARRRRSTKNHVLQSGGVLTVAQGREMVRQKEQSEEERARQLILAAEKRRKNAAKRVFEDSAKIARKKRLSGELEPLYIIDKLGGGRMLRRG
jgi:hypothetical protein